MGTFSLVPLFHHSLRNRYARHQNVRAGFGDTGENDRNESCKPATWREASRSLTSFSPPTIAAFFLGRAQGRTTTPHPILEHRLANIKSRTRGIGLIQQLALVVVGFLVFSGF